MKNPFSFIIGPKGDTHIGIEGPNMTLIDGQPYFHISQNFTMGPDGKTYVQAGGVVFGGDGQTHLAFGDNPKILL